MTHHPSQTVRSDRGAAAVEFAIVSLMLLSLLLGIIEFGFIFQAQIAITNAAREGARMATVGQYNSAVVVQRAAPVTPVTVTAKVNGAAGDPNTATSGQEIQIDVSHAWDWKVLPFPGTTPLHGRAVMRKE
jgi:hypothetical protein